MPVDAWLAVAWSDDLPRGGVDPLVVAGRALVLFRGEGGRPTALDAHCRHLGAHMGYGGEVVGDALRCPFHGWRWERNGHCSDVPYAKGERIPRGARIRSWPAMDRDGFVHLWTGDENAPRERSRPAFLDGADGADAACEDDRADRRPGWRRRYRIRAAGFDPGAWILGHERLRSPDEPDDGAPAAVSREGGVERRESPFAGRQLSGGRARLASFTLGGGFQWVHRVEGDVNALVALAVTPVDGRTLDLRAVFRAVGPDLDAADAVLRSISRRIETDLESIEAQRPPVEPVLTAADLDAGAGSAR
jgi:nitrite reductase/ring-hydroxylating ferredoxin subunit